MKIKKFNESNDNKLLALIIVDFNNEIVHSGVFENEKDFDNWILNLVNISINADPDYKIENTVINNEGEQIFIDVKEAINYYQWYYNYEVIYDYTDVYKNVEVKYGVELMKKTKNYNL